VCRAESPAVEQFAQRHGDEIRVVGMGAQDSLEMAVDFIEDGGLVTPLMIWDASFETWNYYGVTGQPTAVLVDPAGEPVGGWRGVFDEDEVLELATEL
jgi:hypothetical protein